MEIDGNTVDSKSTIHFRVHNKSSAWVKKVSKMIFRDPFDNESMILHRKG